MRPGACGRKCPHVPSALGVDFLLLPFPDLYRSLPLRALRTRRSMPVGSRIALAELRLRDPAGLGPRASARPLRFVSAVGVRHAAGDLKLKGASCRSLARLTTGMRATPSVRSIPLASSTCRGASSLATEAVVRGRIGFAGSPPLRWTAPSKTTTLVKRT